MHIQTCAVPPHDSNHVSSVQVSYTHFHFLYHVIIKSSYTKLRYGILIRASLLNSLSSQQNFDSIERFRSNAPLLLTSSVTHSVPYRSRIDRTSVASSSYVISDSLSPVSSRTFERYIEPSLFIDVLRPLHSSLTSFVLGNTIDQTSCP